jgi:hypothetical protein
MPSTTAGTVASGPATAWAIPQHSAAIASTFVAGCRPGQPGGGYGHGDPYDGPQAPEPALEKPPA